MTIEAESIKKTFTQVRVRGLEGVGEEASNRNQTLERERGETARYHQDRHHYHRHYHHYHHDEKG